MFNRCKRLDVDRIKDCGTKDFPRWEAVINLPISRMEAATFLSGGYPLG